MSLREMTQLFAHHYRVVTANTEQLQDEVYRVRYAVYCQRLKFEDAKRFPDGRECDPYDLHSLHCLLQDMDSGEYVGCVRMIRADGNDASRKLPFEEAWGGKRSDEKVRAILGEMSRNTLAEVSRLAVIFPDRVTRDGISDESRELLRHATFMGMGLYLAAIGLVIDQRLDDIFAMMEPRLDRLLRRYGILFEQKGDVIDYHGRRAPFHVTRKSLVENLSPEMHDLLCLIMADMSRGAGLPFGQTENQPLSVSSASDSQLFHFPLSEGMLRCKSLEDLR